MLTNKKSNEEYKWFYCKKTKNIKITCSQTWNIKSKTHQGSCTPKTHQLATMKKKDSNINSKKLTKKSKPKKTN
jgi:hypothetical protein